MFSRGLRRPMWKDWLSPKGVVTHRSRYSRTVPLCNYLLSKLSNSIHRVHLQLQRQPQGLSVAHIWAVVVTEDELGGQVWRGHFRGDPLKDTYETELNYQGRIKGKGILALLLAHLLGLSEEGKSQKTRSRAIHKPLLSKDIVLIWVKTEQTQRNFSVQENWVISLFLVVSLVLLSVEIH